VLPAADTPQEIRLRWLAEFHRAGAVTAEDDVVCEVGSSGFFFNFLGRAVAVQGAVAVEGEVDCVEDFGGERQVEVAGVVEGCDAGGFEQGAEVGEEGCGEEGEGLGAAGEDVVEDVVVLGYWGESGDGFFGRVVGGGGVVDLGGGVGL